MGQRIAIFSLASLAWFYLYLPPVGKRLCAVLLGTPLALLGLRRGIVRENLERAFPGEGQAEHRAAIERKSYSHLARLALEILMLFGPMRKFVMRHSVLRGTEHWKNAVQANRGVILLSSHVGNWEVMAACGAIHGGMDLMIVTKHLKPEWLHRRIEEGRRSCGVKATYEPSTLKDVLSQLKRGATVGFVLDQYAGPPIGVRVPVFGVPVGTPNAVAALSKRTGAPVLPVVNYRDEQGNFIVEIRPPLEWVSSADYAGTEHANFELAANTAQYARILESDIRRHPDQWLWIHRRFKGDLSPLKPDEWASGRQRR